MATNRRLAQKSGPDFYVTPPWGTRALIDHEPISGRIFHVDETKNTEFVRWRTRFRGYSYDFYVHSSLESAASSMQRNYDVDGVLAHQLCGVELNEA